MIKRHARERRAHDAAAHDHQIEALRLERRELAIPITRRRRDVHARRSCAIERPPGTPRAVQARAAIRRGNRPGLRHRAAAGSYTHPGRRPDPSTCDHHGAGATRARRVTPRREALRVPFKRTRTSRRPSSRRPRTTRRRCTRRAGGKCSSGAPRKMRGRPHRTAGPVSTASAGSPG
jgi:hypothetical protein